MEQYQLDPSIATALVQWFRENQRALPWRNTQNPYDVWLSEIMLQQTRVEAVKEKFLKFRETLPTILDLAQVDDDCLMKLWEGLGYYSRARNLKKCAIELVSKHHAKLPKDLYELKQLPGIGPYTAGAIASIAFNIPTPAVDGNVLRVLTRLFGIKEDIRSEEVKKQLTDILQEFYNQNSLGKEIPNFPSLFNQGLMELGALVCVPNGKPLCHICPWQKNCHAHLNQLTDTIPYRSSLKKRKIIQRTIFILWDGNRLLLHKRPQKGLLAGLYEFPGIDERLTRNQIQETVEQYGVTALHIKRLPDSKHIFTHIEWHMHAYEIKVASIETLHLDNSLLITKKELAQLAVPSAFKTYIDYYALAK